MNRFFLDNNIYLYLLSIVEHFDLTASLGLTCKKHLKVTVAEWLIQALAYKINQADFVFCIHSKQLILCHHNQLHYGNLILFYYFNIFLYSIMQIIIIITSMLQQV